MLQGPQRASKLIRGLSTEAERLLTVKGWSCEAQVTILVRLEKHRVNVGLFIEAGAVDEELKATRHGDVLQSLMRRLVTVSDTLQVVKHFLFFAYEGDTNIEGE